MAKSVLPLIAVAAIAASMIAAAPTLAEPGIWPGLQPERCSGYGRVCETSR